MAKLGKTELARYEGARWVFELIKKKGLEEAERELNWRGVMHAPLNIETAEIKRFELEIKETCKKTMAAMSCMVLHDEFGYGHDRLERFIGRWNLKTECLAEDYIDWPDIATMLLEECGIDLDIPIEYSNVKKKEAV